MRESQSARHALARGGTVPWSNGRMIGPTDPLDRSYLLRRGSRFPFPHMLVEPEPIRLRRERRVFAAFTRIPPLSRGGPV